MTSVKARNGRIPCACDAARIVRRSPRRRGRLQGAAGRERVDEGALDRPRWRRRASVAAVGRITGRLVVGAENLDIRLRLRGAPVALQANVQLLGPDNRSEEHTSEIQSPNHLVCRLLL